MAEILSFTRRLNPEGAVGLAAALAQTFAGGNLAAFCQRCHVNHDRPEHQQRRWRTLFRRRALGDLFRGAYLS